MAQKWQHCWKFPNDSDKKTADFLFLLVSRCCISICSFATYTCAINSVFVTFQIPQHHHVTALSVSSPVLWLSSCCLPCAGAYLQTQHQPARPTEKIKPPYLKEKNTPLHGCVKSAWKLQFHDQSLMRRERSAHSACAREMHWWKRVALAFIQRILKT